MNVLVTNQDLFTMCAITACVLLSLSNGVYAAG